MISTQAPTPPADTHENAYASPTWWYDLRGFGILTFAYQGTLGQQIRFFEQNLRTSHLEVAIGTGTLFQMIVKRSKREGALPEKIVGIDYSADMLEGARRKFRNSPVELLQGTVCSMPIPDSVFDSVNIANALHCFSDVTGALREIKRVMAPGGTLAVNALLYPRGFAPARRIAASINRWGMKKGILHTPFTEDEVLKLFNNTGYVIKQFYTKGNCAYLVASV
jgi:ubiquinone/menaquinone biosynthesis C-methylase UbiE